MLATAYVSFVSPIQSVRFGLPRDGATALLRGLLPNQEAAQRGFRIGEIEDLQITAEGVNAVVRIDSKYQIPASSAVRVSGLSPAGEQYIDFLPTSSNGPFLQDGSVIPLGTAVVPQSLADTLTNSDGALKQMDTKKIEVLKAELGMSTEDPKSWPTSSTGNIPVVDPGFGATETTSLLRTSRVVFDLAADKGPACKRQQPTSTPTFTGVNKMPAATALNATAPEDVGRHRQSVRRQPETMVQLLGSLATTSQRCTTGCRRFTRSSWPTGRRSSMPSRVSCTTTGCGSTPTSTRGTPATTARHGTPSSADYPEPFMVHVLPGRRPGCAGSAARRMRRGPAGDDTAGPPFGADLGRRTDPTPGPLHDSHPVRWSDPPDRAASLRLARTSNTRSTQLSAKTEKPPTWPKTRTAQTTSRKRLRHRDG